MKYTILVMLLISISITGCLLIGCGDPTIQIAGKYYSDSDNQEKQQIATSQPMILPTIPAIIEPAVEPAFWGEKEITAASVLGLAVIGYAYKRFSRKKV